VTALTEKSGGESIFLGVELSKLGRHWLTVVVVVVVVVAAVS